MPEVMESCLCPDCPSTIIHLRGLCRACYLYASTLVFHGLTTWDQLEATGCVRGVTGQIQSPKRPVRTDWFSRATGLTPDALTDELKRRVREYTNRQRRKRGSF